MGWSVTFVKLLFQACEHELTWLDIVYKCKENMLYVYRYKT